MQNSVQLAPDHAKAALRRFGFTPDSGQRKSFSQWRLDVGGPIEYYADVYLKDFFVELYARPRLSKHIAERFSGRIDSELDFCRVLYQVGFISLDAWYEARMELDPPRPATEPEPEWPSIPLTYKKQEEPPF